MYQIYVNTDRPNIHNQLNVINFLKKMGLYSDNPEADIVWNIDSIYNVGLKRGKKLTIYWEVDDYMNPGSNYNRGWYDVDLLYIVHEEYKGYYPDKAKILRVAADPDFHREHPIQKFCDYIFVGSIEFLEVYFNRIVILDHLLRTGADMFITYGTHEKYPYLMSLGRVILDVIPKSKSGNACLHGRIYEAMATGCLMIDYHPMLDRIATKDVHYVTYEKFGKITPEEIDRIKKASREHILKNHTFKHRIDQVLKDIDDYFKK